MFPILALEFDDDMFERRHAVGQLQRFLAVVLNGDFQRVLIVGEQLQLKLSLAQFSRVGCAHRQQRLN